MSLFLRQTFIFIPYFRHVLLFVFLINNTRWLNTWLPSIVCSFFIMNKMRTFNWMIFWRKRFYFRKSILNYNHLFILLLLNIIDWLLLYIKYFSSAILINQIGNTRWSCKVYRHILNISTPADTNCHIRLLRFAFIWIY